MTFKELLNGMSPKDWMKQPEETMGRMFRCRAWEVDRPQIKPEYQNQIDNYLKKFPMAKPGTDLGIYLLVDKAMKDIYPDDDAIWLTCRDFCRGGNLESQESMQSAYGTALL